MAQGDTKLSICSEALIMQGAAPLSSFATGTDEAQVADETEIPDLSLPSALILTLGGLSVLLGSSKALVWGATEVARYFGVSELIIGLTIVAIGT